MRAALRLVALLLLCPVLLCSCLLPPVVESGSTPPKKENEEETPMEYELLDAEIEHAYGGSRATVVIVHDDGTRSTVDYMVERFTEHGLVGTLGLITKNFAAKDENGEWVLKDSEVAYWRGVLDSGTFDVASHSHTHTFWGVSDEAESGWYLDSGNALHEYSYEAGRITSEVADSRQILKMAFPDQRVLAFIKPGFGRHSDENGTRGVQISDRAYEIIKENYIGMRNTGGDVDTMPIANIYSAKSHTVKNTDTAEDWKQLVNEAKSSGGTLIFLFHRIEEDPTNSLRADIDETDEFFTWLGKEVADGRVSNMTLENAMLYSAELEASSLEVRKYSDRITVKLTDTLDDSIYDAPLTVRVPVSNGCSLVTSDRGEQLSVLSDSKGKYVLIDIIPDSDTVTLTEV